MSEFKKKFRVLIVGLGNVGMGYDLKPLRKNFILTHAKAFQIHKQFSLVGGVDLDNSKRMIFEEKFSLPAFVDIKNAIYRTSPDILVVSTTTNTICDLIIELIRDYKIKLILAEKPFSYSLNTAQKISKLCKLNNCKLFINYIRRSEIGVKQVKNFIANYKSSSPIKGNVWYSKGLFNTASHFINLLQYLFGKVTSYKILGVENIDIKISTLGLNEYFGVDFELKFSNAKFTFQSIDKNKFFYNSIEMFGTDFKLNYDFGGESIHIKKFTPGENPQNYNIISKNSNFIKNDFTKIQLQVANQMSEYLKGNDFELCSVDDALETLKVLNGIRELI